MWDLGKLLFALPFLSIVPVLQASKLNSPFNPRRTRKNANTSTEFLPPIDLPMPRQAMDRDNEGAICIEGDNSIKSTFRGIKLNLETAISSRSSASFSPTTIQRTPSSELKPQKCKSEAPNSASNSSRGRQLSVSGSKKSTNSPRDTQSNASSPAIRKKQKRDKAKKIIGEHSNSGSSHSKTKGKNWSMDKSNSVESTSDTPRKFLRSLSQTFTRSSSKNFDDLKDKNVLSRTPSCGKLACELSSVPASESIPSETQGSLVAIYPHSPHTTEIGTPRDYQSEDIDCLYSASSPLLFRCKYVSSDGWSSCGSRGQSISKDLHSSRVSSTSNNQSGDGSYREGRRRSSMVSNSGLSGDLSSRPQSNSLGSGYEFFHEERQPSNGKGAHSDNIPRSTRHQLPVASSRIVASSHRSRASKQKSSSSKTSSDDKVKPRRRRPVSGDCKVSDWNLTKMAGVHPTVGEKSRKASGTSSVSRGRPRASSQCSEEGLRLEMKRLIKKPAKLHRAASYPVENEHEIIITEKVVSATIPMTRSAESNPITPSSKKAVPGSVKKKKTSRSDPNLGKNGSADSESKYSRRSPSNSPTQARMRSSSFHSRKIDTIAELSNSPKTARSTSTKSTPRVSSPSTPRRTPRATTRSRARTPRSDSPRLSRATFDDDALLAVDEQKDVVKDKRPKRPHDKQKRKESFETTSCGSSSTPVFDKLQAKFHSAAEDSPYFTQKAYVEFIHDKILHVMDTEGFINDSNTIYQHADGTIHAITRGQYVSVIFKLSDIRVGLFNQADEIERLFWQTYYLFITPAELVGKVFKRLHTYRPLNVETLKCVDSTLRRWIKQYYYESFSDDVYQILEMIDRHLSHHITTLDPSLHHLYKNLIMHEAAPIVPHIPPHLRVLLSMFDKRNMSAKHFAYQMTLYAHRQLVNCRMSEFLDPRNRNRYNSLLQLHENLTQFILQQILYGPTSKDRLAEAHYFLDIAIDLRKRNDFFNLSAVLFAFKVGPISDLKASLWNRDPSLAKKLDRADYPNTNVMWYLNWIDILHSQHSFFLFDPTKMDHSRVRLKEGGRNLFLEFRGTPKRLVNLDQLKGASKILMPIRVCKAFEARQPLDDRAQEFLSLLCHYDTDHDNLSGHYDERVRALEGEKIRSKPFIRSNWTFK